MDKPVKYYNTTTTPAQTQWYRETTDLHNHIYNTIERIKSSHDTRVDNIHKYNSLYENVSPLYMQHFGPTPETFANKLTYNIVRSIIDTASSKIAANKPRPEFNTDNSNFRDQRQASRLTQLNDGIFYENKTYQLMQEAFSGAMIAGTEGIHVYRQGNKIKNETVKIEEILVDDHEGENKQPQNLFRERNVFRDYLLEKAYNEGWDKKAIQAIKDAPRAKQIADTTADKISVVEAWHLPQLDNDGNYINGRHVAVIQNHTLLDECWDLPGFPFAFFRWASSRYSWYGTSAVEQMVPRQLEIARILRHIAKHMKNTGVKIIVPRGHNINLQHLASQDIPVVESDTTPTPIVFPAVAPETINWLQSLVREAYEEFGISQAQASARKESGVTANASLQTLSDQQVERFQLIGQNYERFSKDIAELNIAFCKKMALENIKPPSDTPNRELFDDIDWQKVNLDTATYKIKVFPISAFSTSPAARIQQIQDAMQAGGIPVDRGIAMITGENPDTREYFDLENSHIQRTAKYLELMKHDGVYNSPDEALDSATAIEMARKEINRSIVQGVSAKRVGLMWDFIAECKRLQDELSQPPPQSEPSVAPMSDLNAPLATPAPPPVSPMLPQ